MPIKEKDWFDKVKDEAKAALKIVKESSIGKGFISAQNSVLGYDQNGIDATNPDGVHSGSKGNSRAMGSKPDQTKNRAIAKDEPFTILSVNVKEVKDGVETTRSKYYSDIVESEFYISTSADPAQKGKKIQVGSRPYSAFNKYSLVNYRGTPLNSINSTGEDGLGEFDGGSIYQKIQPADLINPTVSKIIEITSQNTENYGYRYQYSDFALAKYYNKIPNNLLITLRRFAFPAPDDIVTTRGIGPDGKMEDLQQPDIARAVTWIGEAPGNNIGEILKFNHGFGWKTETANVQTIESRNKESTGKLGNFIQNSKIASAVVNAAAGKDALDSNAAQQNAGYDSFSNTYPNHIFGPLNIIKDVLVREQGLKFEQQFSLKFEYELRAFEGANPKIMMLDQLANILALTYNNAPFWGGSVRYVGDGAVSKPLGNLSKLREGDYSGFIGSIFSDFGKMVGGKDGIGGMGGTAKDILSGDFGALKSNKFLNNMLGGSMMEMLNTPQGGQAVASLLTGDPTGQWHVTIGNPLNPIMVIGNLVLEDCEIVFDGPTGIQDFPERMTVTIKLKPGRPRDKAEIESMFNSGRGRFYIQPDDVADINKTVDISQYGNKDKGKPTRDGFTATFRKISNG